MIGACKSCGYQVGLLSLRSGVCQKCRDHDAPDIQLVGRRNTDTSYDKDDVTTEPTKILMSAVHLYLDDFKDDLKERLRHPYKFPSPELGIDLNKIKQELDIAESSHFLKSSLLFIVMLFSFFVLIQDLEENWIIFLPALALTTLIEFFYIKSATQKVRNILTGICNYESEKIQSKESLSNVVIFGGYSPFVGSGFELSSWSFTVDTNQAADKQSPVGAVSISELHGCISERVKSLGISELKILDELYVNGKDVSLIAELLPNGRFSRPIGDINQQYIRIKWIVMIKQEGIIELSGFQCGITN